MSLTDTGANVQKWTQVFSTRRWVIQYDSYSSHIRRSDASEKKRRRKYSRPLLNVFACGQVSSPRLYRLSQIYVDLGKSAIVNDFFFVARINDFKNSCRKDAAMATAWGLYLRWKILNRYKKLLDNKLYVNLMACPVLNQGLSIRNLRQRFLDYKYFWYWQLRTKQFHFFSQNIVTTCPNNFFPVLCQPQISPSLLKLNEQNSDWYKSIKILI